VLTIWCASAPAGAAIRSPARIGNESSPTAQLIRADNGYHLWSQTYDRDLKDVFKVQDEIAGRVVEELKVTLPTLRTDARYQAFLAKMKLSQ
jgi:hypothetical protein